MSSVQASFAQNGARGRFFVGLNANGVTVVVPTGNAAAGGVNTSVNFTDFAAALVGTAGATAAGRLYRDLGRTVTVHDDNSLLAVQIYQKVAVVDGPDTEGNNADAVADDGGDLYVLVWSANPSEEVGVARV
jgi:hypothetical protein